MLNILWPIIIILLFIYGILNGKVNEINKSIFNSASDTVQLCISLLRDYVSLEWNYANSLAN